MAGSPPPPADPNPPGVLVVAPIVIHFGIVPPKHDKPFLCHHCRQKYTHRSNSCSQMNGFPWILPEMEQDHLCMDCWFRLRHQEKLDYEKRFLNLHGAKFNLVSVLHEQSKYMEMMATLMAEPGR